MALENMLHERIEQARLSKNPTSICKLTSGWVVLGDEQRLPGYCLLLADPAVPSINQLSERKREQFLSDMLKIGDALLRVDLHPEKINYEILGNEIPWLHAHITPRYSWEAELQKTKPPFVYQGMPSVPFDLTRDGALILQLKALLESA